MKRVLILLLAIVVLSACGSKKEEVIISGKPWTEQFILPYLLGYVIEEKTDYDVTYKESLGEVAILTPALDKGEIDLYVRSEEHTSELQSRGHLVCRLLLEKKNNFVF